MYISCELLKTLAIIYTENRNNTLKIAKKELLSSYFNLYCS